MTSEVALLNRSAVALAADSAATVSVWKRDHYDTYYFKGTDKIFQLSAAHPVGIMIYASASLQGAPWHMLIKSYRDQLGDRPHDRLAGYADDLFDYISGNAHIFPPDVQEQQFKSDVDIVAARIFKRIRDDNGFKNAPDDAARTALASALFAQQRAEVTAAPFVGNAEQTDSDSAVAKYETVIRDMLEKDSYYDAGNGFLNFVELANIAIQGQFKIGFTSLNNTGIVIAGFGDKDYFPRLLSYRCFGIVLGKLIMSEETSKHQIISQKDGSAFITFAQDEMMQTFIFGQSARMLAELERRFDKQCNEFYGALNRAGLATDISGDASKASVLKNIKQKCSDDFSTEVIEYSYQEHTRPMRSVLGSLPFDELAELAHTLVLLESLKERVTSPSSSVSGPIDVAVISKNDGFIWIKRKHYFDPRLNSRYFSAHRLPGGVP